MGACGSSRRAATAVQPVFRDAVAPGQGPSTPEHVSGQRNASPGQASSQPCGAADANTESGVKVDLDPSSGSESIEASGLVVRAPSAQNSTFELFCAVKAGRFDEVERHIAEGHADLVNSRGMWGNTPVVVAAQYGHSELAIALLSRWGADGRILNDSGAGALLFACVEGNIALAKACIVQGSAVELPPAVVYCSTTDSNLSLTPMAAAVVVGSKEVAGLLVQHGAMVHTRVPVGPGKQGDSEFLVAQAVRFVRPGILIELLERGAQFSAEVLRDSGTQTCFLGACQSRHMQAAELDQNLCQMLTILENELQGQAPGLEALVDATEDARGLRPLLVTSQRKLVMTATKLVGLGVNVKHADRGGTTALHYAVKAKSEDLVKVLIKAGADPRAMDQYRRSPLNLARSSGGAKAVLLPILQAKVDMEQARERAAKGAEAQELLHPSDAENDGENETKSCPESLGKEEQETRNAERVVEIETEEEEQASGASPPTPTETQPEQTAQ